MNSIPSAQNEQRHIEQLAAMQRLYSDAKFWLGAQMIGIGVGSVGFSLWAAHDPTHPQVSVWGGLWGVGLALVDYFLITPHQKRLKKTAANVQEMFDCEVLQLARPRKYERVEPEIIAHAAERHAKSVERHKKSAERRKKPAPKDKIINWYPVGVGALPLPLARILCQRANCWWDADLRERYIKWIYFIIAAIVLGVLIYGLIQQFRIDQLAKSAALPLVPLVLLGIRQILENREAAAANSKLKDEANKLWDNALKNPHDLSKLDEQSRDLQDDIWEQRGKSPVIFDWIYDCLRHDNENHMNKGAEALIKDAQKVLNQTP